MLSAVEKLIRSMAERLHSAASVKAVYGEPISAEGKTIIPVARVAYGFGAGGGTEAAGVEEHNGNHSGREGSGGGGGVAAKPAGVIEITPEGTRYIEFGRTRRLGIALAAGFFIGWRLGRRFGRRHDKTTK